MATLARAQFKKMTKEDVVKLAADMGLSTEGTKAEIVERICAEEVEYPDSGEAEAVEGKEEDQAAEEAGEEPEEMVPVKCIKEFRDLQADRKMREFGEVWEVPESRAKMLEGRRLAVTI